jgi:hypothetical protein
LSHSTFRWPVSYSSPNTSIFVLSMYFQFKYISIIIFDLPPNWLPFEHILFVPYISIYCCYRNSYARLPCTTPRNCNFNTPKYPLHHNNKQKSAWLTFLRGFTTCASSSIFTSIFHVSCCSVTAQTAGSLWVLILFLFLLFPI